MTEKLNHARVPRRFYILTLLIFVPIFYCLLAIRAHWYGWAIAVVAFAGLVAIRRSRFSPPQASAPPWCLPGAARFPCGSLPAAAISTVPSCRPSLPLPRADG